MENENGWREWERHVLAEIKRLGDVVGKLEVAITNLTVDIVTLKTESKIKKSLWGFLGGIIAIVITALINKHFRII